MALKYLFAGSDEADTASIEESPINVIMPSPAPFEMRSVGLYGHVNEERGSELVYNLFRMAESGKYFDEETDELRCEPLRFVICTPGGTSSDMFAIYDAMRIVKETCDIETLAIGEVMSAGVLLLAAGTRGHRKIGRNCRVMLHSITAGSHGSMNNMENEMEEFRWIQSRYAATLKEETKMTKNQIKKIFNSNVDVYFDAEQAVKYGIVDEVI
tara:strand:+ start:160 stop:798 length:639 start_codon:yes stop_codon:yes gene_type:complete